MVYKQIHNATIDSRSIFRSGPGMGVDFVTWLSCRILVNFKFKKLVASNDPKSKHIMID